jgi:hypothetical protein
LGLLFEADRDCHLDRIAGAAMICSLIWNVNYEDKRPPGDFMPGAVVKTEEEKLIEFAERVMAGDTFEDGAPEEEEIERCRREVAKTFKNVRQN